MNKWIEMSLEEKAERLEKAIIRIHYEEILFFILFILLFMKIQFNL